MTDCRVRGESVEKMSQSQEREV